MLWWLLGIIGYLLAVFLICRVFRVAGRTAPPLPATRPNIATQAPSWPDGVPDRAA